MIAAEADLRRRRRVANSIEGRAGRGAGSRRDPRGAEAARTRSRRQRGARRLGSRPDGALGVPILDLSQDATNYFDVHHTTNDTLEQIDAKTLNQVVAAYAVAAYLAASKNGDFGRVEATANQ